MFINSQVLIILLEKVFILKIRCLTIYLDNLIKIVNRK